MSVRAPCSAAPLACLLALGPACDPGGGPGRAGRALAIEAVPLGAAVPPGLGLDRDRVLYLTFDDGPDPATTPQVLRVLGRHGVPATFFVTGERIPGNEALLRRAAAAGHQVASHQLVHEVAPPPGDTRTFRDWVRAERALLDAVLGRRHTRYFRYPYGDGSAAKERVLRELGYRDGGVGWDIDALDWCFGDGGGTCERPEVPVRLRDDFLGYVLSRVRAARGGVVLLHDVQELTAAGLDELLDTLKDEGYRFAALPDRP